MTDSPLHPAEELAEHYREENRKLRSLLLEVIDWAEADHPTRPFHEVVDEAKQFLRKTAWLTGF